MNYENSLQYIKKLLLYLKIAKNLIIKVESLKTTPQTIKFDWIVNILKSNRIKSLMQTFLDFSKFILNKKTSLQTWIIKKIEDI